MKYKNEINQFISIIVLCVVSRYFVPKIIGDVVFWLLIILFIKAKPNKNHFWVMIFWFLLSAPGYLFSESGLYRLPVIPVPGLNREIEYIEIVTILTIGKAIIKPIKQNIFLNRIFVPIGIYAIFLLLYGFIIGTTLISSLKAVRLFIPLLLIFAIPKIIPYKRIPDTIKILFLCVIILFTMQIIDIVTGMPLAAKIGENKFLFSGTIYNTDAHVFDVTKNTVRTIYGPFMILLNLIICFSLLTKSNQSIRPQILLSQSGISLISIFLSATRSWIIAAAFITIVFIIITSKRIIKVVIAGSIIMLVAISIPMISLQLERAYERTKTIELLLRGDLTAGGTLSRITQRGPRVMNKYYERPIFGHGYSDEYFKYSDGHVGNQNLLLQGGIIGLIIYVIVINNIIINIYNMYNIDNNKSMIIFIAGIIGLLIIHANAMIFGYSMNSNVAIFLAIYLMVINYHKTSVIKVNKSEEKSYKGVKPVLVRSLEVVSK